MKGMAFRHKVACAALFSVFLWATGSPAIKLGLPYCPPIFFASIRFLLGGFVLLCITAFFEKDKSVFLRSLPGALRVAAVQTFVLYLIFYIGMKHTDASVGAIMNGLIPITTAIAAHFVFHDQRLTRLRVFFLVLGVAGAAVIGVSRGCVHGFFSADMLGIVLSALGCCCSALGNIVTSRTKVPAHAVTLNAMQQFLGGCMLMATALLFEGVPTIDPQPMFFASWVWLAFQSATAFSVWFMLLAHKDVKVSDLSIWMFVIPVVGAIMSWAVVPGDHPTVWAVVGMVTVGVSVYGYNAVSAVRRREEGYVQA